MIAKVKGLLVASCAAAGLALAMPAPADTHSPRDPFGLGLDITELCDLAPGAPLGERCYGFIGAVVEMVMAQEIFRPDGSRQYPAICLPENLTIAEIFEVIQPRLGLAAASCTGFCTASSVVIASLAYRFPCQE